MKTALDGKIYDTETATLIHEASRAANYGDGYSRWQGIEHRALYETRKGAYFFVVTEKIENDFFYRLFGAPAIEDLGTKLLPATPEDAANWLIRCGGNPSKIAIEEA